MTIRRTRNPVGIELTPNNIQGIGGTNLTREGEIATDSSDSELKVRLNAATRTVVTEDQTQVLTNKTIDADLNTISDLEVDNLKSGVLNVSTTLLGASNAQLPSALAVKTYVDNGLALQNQASEISVTPAGTIAATNVQAAIEELDGDIQGHINDIVDAHDASAISVTPNGNLAATEVQAALVELQTDIDNINSAAGTFTNKNLDDATVSFVDTSDATKKISFDAIGTTGTKTTIASSQTANRTITLPDATTDMVGHNNIQTIANKSFNDDSNFFVDPIDSSKKIRLNAEGTTSTTTTITSSQTANRTVTLPDATDTLVGKATTDTLTNKTLTSPVITTPTGIVKADVGLGNVDNTSDVNKPVSTAQQTALDLKVNTTGGSIITPARLDMKQDTLANLTTYALTATNGQLVFATNTKDTYVVKDGALSPVGGGGGGASALVDLTDVNILTPVNSQVLTYDSATSTWRNRPVDKEPEVMEDLNFDYSLTTDFTQTGLAISTANPIRGVKSAQLISAGSTQSFKKVLAVDPEFRGKNNTLSIYTRSSATQGNVTILITDETNAATLAASQPITLGSTTITATTTSASATLSAISTTDINLLKVGQTITGAGIPAGTIISAIGTSTAIMSQNASASATITPKISALPARQAFTFDIPNNCASLSYTISALAETGSPESYFDDITIKLTERVGTTASVTVPRKVATKSYVPTFTGFGTPTNIEFEYDEDGEYYNIRGKFTSGTTTATEARVSLPNSAVSASGSLLPSISLAGSSVFSTNSATAYYILIEPSVSYLTFSIQAGTANSLTKQNANAISSSGERFSFTARVPIANAAATESLTIPLTSSQLVQTPDSHLQMNGFGASLASTATQILRLTSPTVISNTGDAIQYVADSVNGDKFIALKDGEYHFNISADNVGASSVFGLSKNTTQVTTPYQSLTNSSERLQVANNSDVCSLNWSGKLVAGDILRLHEVNSSGINSGYSASLSFSYAGSLKQLNFSTDSKIQIPTHQLRFEGASSRGSTDTAIVKFDTQAITQGDAWSVVNSAANGTVITMLKAGKLSVASSLSLTSTSELSFITKNQAVLTTTPVAAEIYATSSAFAGTATISMTAPIDVVVGDKIRICANGGITSNAVNNFTLSLTESSIPANFSNVLPQWSQSDSSVRLDTANGYGSTGTKIRRFSNNPMNIGSAMTYTDSATDGPSIKINEEGLFDIYYQDNFNSASDYGVSLNASSTSLAFSSLTQAEKLLQATTSQANYLQPASEQVYLMKGDIIRPHTDGLAVGTRPVVFQISKVGKPNLSSVDVTSFVNMKTTDTEAIEALTATSTFGATNTGVPVLNITRNTNLGVIRVDSSAANGTSFVALKDCTVNINASADVSGNTFVYITRNATILTATAPDGIIERVASNGTNGSAFIGTEIKVNAGDTIRFQKASGAAGAVNQLTLTATADNNATASPTQQVFSDTMSFVFKATAIDPATDAIGTFNTYTYASGGNVATLAATAPTQTTSSMNINGIQVFSRAGNATSTAASPARVDVFIGKGLQSTNLSLFKSAAKSIIGTIDYTQADGKLDAHGCRIKEYNPTTGILQIDAGAVLYPSSNTYHVFQFSDNTEQNNGYVTFSASKAPVLTTVPNLQMRTAYITEQQPSGTNSTTVATAATWCDRVLNTIVDSTGIVTSLASNTVTLQAGTYSVEGWATQYTNAAGVGKVRLRNTTDGVTSVVGSSEYYGQGTQTFKSILRGEVTITSTKTFKLQTYFANTVGGGTASTTGDNELYASLVITKIK